MTNSPLIIWGMLHLPALPGSPNNKLSLDEILSFVKTDTQAFYDSGVTNVVLENLGDVPYSKYNSDHHTATFMTKIGLEIISEFPDISLGINVLRNDAFSALAVAKSLESNSKFIRINILSGVYVSDQGIIEGNADKVLRYKKNILANNIEIWSDVRVKHASPLVERPIEEEITENLDRAGASKIILSGSMTGKEVELGLLKYVNEHVSPENIVLGSGVNAENFADYKTLASNFIVGSSLKKDNKITNHVDKNKVKLLVDQL